VWYALMWRWGEKKFGIDRTNPYEGVQAYLEHIRSQREEVRKWCGYTGTRSWIVAEARAARGRISSKYRKSLLSLPSHDRHEIESKYQIDLDRISLIRSKIIGREELPVKVIKNAERCFDETGHYHRLKRWRKNWSG